MIDRLPFILSAVMFAALAALGGASRASEVAQLPLRLIAVVVIAVALWSPPMVRLARYRPLFLFLGACAALAAIQLVPLPAGLWQALPGRGFYADAARQVGIADVARPLSFAPQLTLHALLALLVPAAVLVSVAAVPAARLAWGIGVLLALVLAGLVLGYLQMAGGAASPWRFYAVTNRDAMVGLFANRNHHALLLAMALPVLFGLAGVARHARPWRTLGPALAGLGGLLVAITLLLAGSRGGLLVGAAGALAGALLFASTATTRGRPRKDQPAAAAIPWWRRGSVLVVASVALALVLLATVFARLPAMQRLLRTDAAEEVRAQLFWPTVELAWAMVPLGGGIGAFDQLFRRFEPVAHLRLSYQNQAHMEPLQVVIEAGVPGLVLVALLLWWWGRRTLAAWRLPRPTTATEVLPRLGSILVAMPLLLSLGDYPLRTPIHAALFAVAAIWLELGARAYQSGRLRGR